MLSSLQDFYIEYVSLESRFEDQMARIFAEERTQRWEKIKSVGSSANNPQGHTECFNVKR